MYVHKIIFWIAGFFISEVIDNKNNKDIVTVIENWDDVRKDVNINLDDIVNSNNDLEIWRNLNDADILTFITNNGAAFIR